MYTSIHKANTFKQIKNQTQYMLILNFIAKA